jgi:F0F1-type ATP synthase membrane subunit c/vacuolar-type H+-ATPase subunit K
MAIAGLICSLLGTGVASYQYYVLSQAADQLANDPEVQKSFDELEESMESLDTLSVE